MKILLKIGYYILLIFIVIVAIILFVPALPIENNIQTKVVLSGSMEPAIRVGSVVVIKPLNGYHPGDIITFGEDSRTSIPTTHRIIDERLQNGITYFKTKGDANPRADATEVSTNDVIGRVLFSIPLLGYVIDFAKKPLGFALLIIVPGAIIVLDEGRKIYQEIRRMRRKKQREEVNE